VLQMSNKAKCGEKARKGVYVLTPGHQKRDSAGSPKKWGKALQIPTRFTTGGEVSSLTWDLMGIRESEGVVTEGGKGGEVWGRPREKIP